MNVPRLVAPDRVRGRPGTGPDGPVCREGVLRMGRTERPAEELHGAEEDDDDGAHADAREESEDEVAGDGGQHSAGERERQRERHLPGAKHHRLLLHDAPRLHSTACRLPAAHHTATAPWCTWPPSRGLPHTVKPPYGRMRYMRVVKGNGR